MPKLPELEQALDRGLAYLASQQAADGSFVSYSSVRRRPFVPIREWHTVFVPALMLGALATVEQPAARPIRSGLAEFLLREQTANGAFNYWARSAPERQSLPYPDDLDDTFCALSALSRHDPALVGGKLLAQAVKLLLATEMAVGGPYRTWLVPPDSPAIWLDVDLAVNSNVAYFLSLVSKSLPRLEELMGAAIRTGSFSSPYYPSVYPFIYYFARAYHGPERQRLLQRARRLSQTADLAALDRALCLTARRRLGETQDLTPQVRMLLKQQRLDGAWPAAAFYADPVKQGKVHYNGGEALTTAFVLEALALSVPARQPPVRSAPVWRQTALSVQTARVLTLAERQCRTMAPELRATLLESLRRLAAGSNGPEIIGLAGRFRESLKRPVGAVSDSLLTTLSLANLYGWLAYTICDDFLDGEGRPELLPAATAALRKSLAGFAGALPDNRPFQRLVAEVFDTIDGANAWELANCRFQRRGGTITIGELPDYGDLAPLAQRSLGHTLAPLAVLMATGVSEQRAAFRHVRRALRHYLIARQLNDDAHDWPADLERGHITSVVTRLLTELAVTSGRHQLAGLLIRARRQFWHSTLPAVCDEIQQHLNASRRALDQAAVLKADNVMAELLDGIEASLRETLGKQQQTEQFLAQYAGSAGRP